MASERNTKGGSKTSIEVMALCNVLSRTLAVCNEHANVWYAHPLLLLALQDNGDFLPQHIFALKHMEPIVRPSMGQHGRARVIAPITIVVVRAY